MKKHFVTFLSPGTFVSEETTKEIDSWDVDRAVEMAKGIIERHNAKPYGFYFTTRSRGADDLDSKEASRSGIYYLGGEVLTLGEVKARKNPADNILICNMECNHWDKIITNTNSYRITLPLEASDVVLPWKERK